MNRQYAKFIVFSLISSTIWAQQGVGTNNPNAALDINRQIFV